MNLEMTTSIEQKEKDQPAALSGGEDTSMDHAEDGREPAAEIQKEDDFVAAANARDTVVVNAVMSTPMSQSEHTKAVMDYLQSRQAKEQPQNDRPRGQGRGQANYVDRNRGGGPGRGRGRGRGMAGRSRGRGYGY
ncbi:hypothetical protein WJX77_002030 [Trebouxia sp. C0004]